MRRAQTSCLLLVLSLSLAFGAWFATAAPLPRRASSRLPVTTTSAVAKRQFEMAMQNMEEIRHAEALQNLRAAVKSDPQFAQAYMLIAHLTHDPEEQRVNRAAAQRFAARASAPERLLITWLAKAQEGNYVPAIAAMNDVLSEFPQDQRLAFLVGAWLVNQQRYSQAVMVLERAVTLNPDYPAAWNELAYAYAFSGNFAKAFEAMDRYVALQPEQPNPHDSYGEILRMAGKFEGALQEYRTSIRLDPGFGSEVGVADTYAVMGKEQEARDEYERAVVFVNSEHDKVQYELQSAITWIREDNHREAEHALREVSKRAHKGGFARLEAEAYRVRAMCDVDYKGALKSLQAAQQVLEEHWLSRSDHDDELALILQAKAVRSAAEGDTSTSALAVAELESMAENSRSQTIQLSWHGAAGALLAAETKIRRRSRTWKMRVKVLPPCSCFGSCMEKRAQPTPRKQLRRNWLD